MDVLVTGTRTATGWITASRGNAWPNYLPVCGVIATNNVGRGTVAAMARASQSEGVLQVGLLLLLLFAALFLSSLFVASFSAFAANVVVGVETETEMQKHRNKLKPIHKVP